MSDNPEAEVFEEREIESYDEGIMNELYGHFFSRSCEYEFAVDRAFNLGLFRGPPEDTPILDIGCRDPYDGLLKYVRGLRWRGKYIGLDLDPPTGAVTEADRDEDVDIVQIDLEGADLPFPPTDDHMFKLFAVAFCIEVLGHIAADSRDYLVEEMQRVAGSVFVIGPNAAFKGLHSESPYHKDEIAVEQLIEWGFQHTGYANFNGRDPGTDDFYTRDNGVSATSSEVWGVWTDHVVEERFRNTRNRKPRTFEMYLEDGEVKQRGDSRAAPNIMRDERKR